MKRRAICPVCGYLVPRVWFTKRRFRPCPGCFVPIKAVTAHDRFWSILIGAVSGFIILPALVLSLAFFFHLSPLHPAGLITAYVSSAIAAVFISTFIGYLSFPYFAPFEKSTTLGLACPTCGYDLRETPARCPECGTTPKRVQKGI